MDTKNKILIGGLITTGIAYGTSLIWESMDEKKKNEIVDSVVNNQKLKDAANTVADTVHKYAKDAIDNIGKNKIINVTPEEVEESKKD